MHGAAAGTLRAVVAGGGVPASGTLRADRWIHLAEGVDLPRLIEQVKRRYLEEALRAANGNKTKAVTLVGLANYQTLTNWMKQCGMG
jgi:DNA-binding NtrC family response regulator